MKKNYFKILGGLFLMLFISVQSFAQLGTTTFNTASDIAGNYGGTWTNGSNQGSGFGTWVFTNSVSNSGFYIGGTGQGDPSFGIYSENSGNFAAAQRNFSSALKMGEKISVNIGHTATINGEIFVQLLDDGAPVFTLKFVGGDDRWRINDGGSDFDSGQMYSANNSLAFTFSYNEDGTYSYSFGSGNGSNFTATNNISGINSIKFQTTNQGGGQNFGFNNLSIDSKYTITNNSTVASDANITIPYLEVQAGSTVNIGTNSNTTISGNLTVNGNLNINSGSSLIVNGTSTGNVTYNRAIDFVSGNLNGWHLVSSPVSGEDMTDMRANNNFAPGSGGDRIGFASYTPTTNQWSYFTTASTDALAAGKGFSAKLGSTGNLSFTGTINTADVNVSITSDVTGYFNLVGNPYTSFINSKTFLEDNTNLFPADIWVWDSATNNYITYSAVDEFKVAPGQGFFVKATSGTTVDFTASNQLHNADTFQKSSKIEVKLMMNDGSADRFAKMYYLDNATKGFDNGFDGETFGGIENNVDVFTNLLENNEGKKFQVQSLPIAEMETMIVPVGVKAAAGKEITFTAEAMNLPGDVKVFLEDRVTNTITRLDQANTSYKVTLNDALNGTGRFFLHTKASGVLSTDDIALQNTSIYAINNNTLRVVGLPSGNANVKMYSILGKQVMQTSFSSTGVKEISLPKLSTGMYIVQVETAAGKLNKKIVLE
ncbi:T9SS type A sorting domain-containing protein [Polaribacter gangjinensis]|uniref:Secretion system C-terminal sorting domain-containing protein n=1 Tax=Polaribacter gangjinensis TaxID=574710 RepID=A0A2S7W900_9FLAO|nr:T9SS type A sorting domain-containing protein [Polaribacter gangjinensis]PQJ74063.1 hypothetical protein BTO13_01695 [Polaribacter gangjinensis]